MTEQSEIQELVEQAKRGDQAAFGKIYDEFSQPVYNFLFSRLKQKQNAEDLLQTIFLKAWKNLRTYKQQADAKFSTWLFQIANYTLIDHWRTRKETTDLEKIDNLPFFAIDPILYEEYSYLWKALGELSEDYQTVIDLRFRQDMGIAETAHIMNKSEVGIRVLQHRAIKALKNLLIHDHKI